MEKKKTEEQETEMVGNEEGGRKRKRDEAGFREEYSEIALSRMTYGQRTAYMYGYSPFSPSSYAFVPLSTSSSSSSAAASSSSSSTPTLTKEEEKKRKEFEGEIEEGFQGDAKQKWNDFFLSNTTHFFKDRHWIIREFPELKKMEAPNNKILEVGCGVGNTTFPVLLEAPSLFFYSFDISPAAVKLLQKHEKFDKEKCIAFAHDITTSPAPSKIVPESSCHGGILFFVLSAVSSIAQERALQNMYKSLAPNSLVFFRDYARGDLAQLRFEETASKNKISDNLYARTDGTMAYFFDEEELKNLFSRCGFDCVRSAILTPTVVNNKEKKSMDRVFVQGVFRKREEQS